MDVWVLMAEGEARNRLVMGEHHHLDTDDVIFWAYLFGDCLD